ncbi:hypothetical protein ACIOD1_12765 [Streptomyces sp. NPDC088097]|uniref:hypothetical protein n=1 Tax=Streptomyces sp. NPDC088097 TaxID=3365823 RepID=UPI00382ACA4C
MFGRKSQKIANLERLVRIRTAELADTREDYKALRGDVRDIVLSDLDSAAVQNARLARAVRACARYRAELSKQGRASKRLASQLLDATGHNGRPLEPAARVALGITPKDVAK